MRIILTVSSKSVETQKKLARSFLSKEMNAPKNDDYPRDHVNQVGDNPSGTNTFEVTVIVNDCDDHKDTHKSDNANTWNKFCVDYSKRGKAKSKVCKKPIIKDELRVGMYVPFKGNN